MEEPKTEITLREVYDVQQQMLACLHSMRAKMEDIPDHEDRLRKLEFRQRLWAGALAVLAVVVPPILSLWAVQTFNV